MVMNDDHPCRVGFGFPQSFMFLWIGKWRLDERYGIKVRSPSYAHAYHASAFDSASRKIGSFAR